ncbi:hypothetical protein L6R52_40440 [Myxococcota bacterium]|nr:hypothetical protein [Myxococcota bacterium]
MRRELLGAPVLLLAGLVACGESSSKDAGVDAQVPIDAGHDAGTVMDADAAEVPDGGDAGEVPDSGDAGVVDTGVPPGPDWTCVGSVVAPTPSVATSWVGLTFLTIDGFTIGGPVIGARVDVCAGRDPACTSPIWTEDTDGSGHVALSVPTGDDGFDGYFRVTAAGAAPMVLFQHPPIAHPGVPWSGPWIIPELADLEVMATTATVTLDAGKGTLLVLTANCHYLDYPFVRSETSELTVTAAGLLPDWIAFDDSASMFFNLDAGPVTIEVSHTATGHLVGRAVVFVEAGGYAQTVLGPTPL